MLKADLHIHTKYSIDCNMPLEKVISHCLEKRINCIAIADHGTIKGAVEMQNIAPFPVIVAEEILTPQGEIMGMFLKEGIPNGLSMEEAISRIRAQGALLCIPHPFDIFTRHGLGDKMLEALAGQIDVIEVLNSRSPLHRRSAEALAFAKKYGIPQSAGSDAHTPNEIGNAYVEMPEFNGKDDFMNALTKGKISGHRSNPLVHFGSIWAVVKKRL